MEIKFKNTLNDHLEAISLNMNNYGLVYNTIVFRIIPISLIILIIFSSSGILEKTIVLILGILWVVKLKNVVETLADKLRKGLRKKMLKIDPTELMEKTIIKDKDKFILITSDNFRTEIKFNRISKVIESNNNIVIFKKRNVDFAIIPKSAFRDQYEKDKFLAGINKELIIKL